MKVTKKLITTLIIITLLISPNLILTHTVASHQTHLPQKEKSNTSSLAKNNRTVTPSPKNNVLNPLSFENFTKKVDPLLFNLTFLEEEGYLGEKNTVRLLIKGNPPNLPCVKVLRKNNILNYTLISTPYNEIEKLALSSSISKIILDRKAKICLNETIPILKPNWTLVEQKYGKEINGSGIIVAVLDTGIDLGHPDLKNAVIGNVTFVNEDIYDHNGHGTHVAGIIAASGNASNGKFKGVAYGVKILNVKVANQYGSAWLSDIIDGITWAVNHSAKIISLSFGATPDFTIWSPFEDSPFYEAVRWAVSQGTLVVIAAGNDGEEGHYYINTLAHIDEAFTVGALNKDLTLAYYSSIGPTLDLRLKPDIVAIGSNVISTKPWGIDFGTPIESPLDQYYTMASGTSMATPFVSGISALIFQVYPDMSPMEVKSLLMSTATVLVNYTPYEVGAGLINATSALLSPFYFYPTYINFQNKLNGSQTIFLRSLINETLNVQIVAEFYAENGTLLSGFLETNVTSVVLPPYGEVAINVTLHHPIGVPLEGFTYGYIWAKHSNYTVHATVSAPRLTILNVTIIDENGEKYEMGLNPYNIFSNIYGYFFVDVNFNETISTSSTIHPILNGDYYVCIYGDTLFIARKIKIKTFGNTTNTYYNLTIDLRTVNKITFEPKDPNGDALNIRLLSFNILYYFRGEKRVSGREGVFFSKSAKFYIDYGENVSGFDGYVMVVCGNENIGESEELLLVYFIFDENNRTLSSTFEIDYAKMSMSDIYINPFVIQTSMAPWISATCNRSTLDLSYDGDTNFGRHIRVYYTRNTQWYIYHYLFTWYSGTSNFIATLSDHEGITVIPLPNAKNYTAFYSPALPIIPSFNSTITNTSLKILYPIFTDNNHSLFVLKPTGKMKIYVNKTLVKDTSVAVWKDHRLPYSNPYFTNPYLTISEGNGNYTVNILVNATDLNHTTYKMLNLTLGFKIPSLDSDLPRILHMNLPSGFDAGTSPQVPIFVNDSSGIRNVTFWVSYNSYGNWIQTPTLKINDTLFVAQFPQISEWVENISVKIKVEDSVGNWLEYSIDTAMLKYRQLNIDLTFVRGETTCIKGSSLNVMWENFTVDAGRNLQFNYTLTDGENPVKWFAAKIVTNSTLIGDFEILKTHETKYHYFDEEENKWITINLYFVPYHFKEKTILLEHPYSYVVFNITYPTIGAYKGTHKTIIVKIKENLRIENLTVVPEQVYRTQNVTIRGVLIKGDNPQPNFEINVTSIYEKTTILTNGTGWFQYVVTPPPSDEADEKQVVLYVNSTPTHSACRTLATFTVINYPAKILDIWVDRKYVKTSNTTIWVSEEIPRNETLTIYMKIYDFDQSFKYYPNVPLKNFSYILVSNVEANYNFTPSFWSYYITPKTIDYKNGTYIRYFTVKWPFLYWSNYWPNYPRDPTKVAPIWKMNITVSLSDDIDSHLPPITIYNVTFGNVLPQASLEVSSEAVYRGKNFTVEFYPYDLEDEEWYNFYVKWFEDLNETCGYEKHLLSMYGYLHILLPNGTHLIFERVNEEGKRNIVETLQIPYDMSLGNITVWAEVWDADGAYLKTQNITVEVLNNPPLIDEIFLSNITVDIGESLTVKVNISDLEGQIKSAYIVLKVGDKILTKNLTLINGEYVVTFSYQELKELFGEETSKNIVFEIHAVDMDNGKTLKTETIKITIIVEEEEGGGKPQFPTVTIAAITITGIAVAIYLYRRKLKLKP